MVSGGVLNIERKKLLGVSWFIPIWSHSIHRLIDFFPHDSHSKHHLYFGNFPSGSPVLLRWSCSRIPLSGAHWAGRGLSDWCMASSENRRPPISIDHYSSCSNGNLDQTNPSYIVELRTPAMPVGVGGGKERGGCHLNLRTWHAEGRRPILGLCWPSLGLCWPILRLCWPMPMRTKCCNLQHFALWDGKNPCKYNSFSPRKWLKHSYLQSFVHITIFDFLKNV